MTEQFEIFKEELEIDPPDTREDAFALYGYYLAFASFGRITFDELKELQNLLGLTDEEVDNLSI